MKVARMIEIMKLIDSGHPEKINPARRAWAMKKKNQQFMRKKIAEYPKLLREREERHKKEKRIKAREERAAAPRKKQIAAAERERAAELARQKADAEAMLTMTSRQKRAVAKAMRHMKGLADIEFSASQREFHVGKSPAPRAVKRDRRRKRTELEQFRDEVMARILKAGLVARVTGAETQYPRNGDSRYEMTVRMV